MQLYNTGIFQGEIFKLLGKVSIGSIYRQRALLDYNKDWTALVGQYKYSTREEYRTTLNEKQTRENIPFGQNSRSELSPLVPTDLIEIISKISKDYLNEKQYIYCYSSILIMVNAYLII